MRHLLEQRRLEAEEVAGQREVEQLASAVEGLRLPPDDMWRMLGIVNDYVLGNALRVASTGSARDLVDTLSSSDRAALPEVDTLARIEETRLDDNFEVGLQAVLEGVDRCFVSGRR